MHEVFSALCGMTATVLALPWSIKRSAGVGQGEGHDQSIASEGNEPDSSWSRTTTDNLGLHNSLSSTSRTHAFTGT